MLKGWFHCSGHVQAATPFDSVVMKQSKQSGDFCGKFSFEISQSLSQSALFNSCSAFKMLQGSLVAGLNSMPTPVLTTPQWLPI